MMVVSMTVLLLCCSGAVSLVSTQHTAVQSPLLQSHIPLLVPTGQSDIKHEVNTRKNQEINILSSHKIEKFC